MAAALRVREPRLELGDQNAGALHGGGMSTIRTPSAAAAFGTPASFVPTRRVRFGAKNDMLYRELPNGDSPRAPLKEAACHQQAHNREVSMKTSAFSALLLGSLLAAGTATSQPAPFNEVGATMGHWHFISKDVEANKKIFTAMGGKLLTTSGPPVMVFPGIYINLTLGDEKGDGGSRGSVVNHVGFIVDNVQKRVAEWKAAGIDVLPGGNNRLDQAYVETPDGVRIEILENKNQTIPIQHEHVHFFLPESEIPKAVAWYAKTFGGKPGTRANAPVVDVPGAQLRFAKADTAQAPTRHRVLDHIGFDVKDHAAFVQKIQAEGIKLDEPVRKTPTGTVITYITDPWGTRIEIIQRAPVTQ
jgi:catechol 2,3-dioxygenase-like lactoylglutathione lyase family enzyme